MQNTGKSGNLADFTLREQEAGIRPLRRYMAAAGRRRAIAA
jgi:hypothetical protein